MSSEFFSRVFHFHYLYICVNLDYKISLDHTVTLSICSWEGGGGVRSVTGLLGMPCSVYEYLIVYCVRCKVGCGCSMCVGQEKVFIHFIIMLLRKLVSQLWDDEELCTKKITVDTERVNEIRYFRLEI
jgi:hypothetical protein